ncbi:MAG: site-specific integrase, partial [Firmicutes bacterium]|nr:site-specific integrase [Bacillota bacterium]
RKSKKKAVTKIYDDRDNPGLEEATVHCLRHSFAKNLVDAGTPLQVVAQLAGHESLQTTRRYVTPIEADLRRGAHRSCTALKRKL